MAHQTLIESTIWGDRLEDTEEKEAATIFCPHSIGNIKDVCVCILISVDYIARSHVTSKFTLIMGSHCQSRWLPSLAPEKEELRQMPLLFDSIYYQLTDQYYRELFKLWKVRPFCMSDKMATNQQSMRSLSDYFDRRNHLEPTDGNHRTSTWSGERGVTSIFLKWHSSHE